MGDRTCEIQSWTMRLGFRWFSIEFDQFDIGLVCKRYGNDEYSIS